MKLGKQKLHKDWMYLSVHHCTSTMFVLVLAIAIIGLVEGICYVPVADTTPREILDQFQMIGPEYCKMNALGVPRVESVRYNAETLMCTYLGDAVIGSCGETYERYAKQTTCPQGSPTANHAADTWCFMNAKMSPDVTNRFFGPVCPNSPLDGEATARVYVVSVILSNGQYAVYDNNANGAIVWDEESTSWVYVFQIGREVYVREPIYSATCAYYPVEGSNDCGCPEMVLDPGTEDYEGAITPTEGDSGACPSDYTGQFTQVGSGAIHKCDRCSNYKYTCINGLWIIAYYSGGEIIDTFAISSGTCYPARTASA
ncbi:hypothetical protein PRIPAC_79085 [Pristionchus pacificus]|uniref:Uncharacterized protein n=1 Tax=Pristionchus pacificus TaxID=54126 RepID=A0A2A6CLQ5_PRIPA|nr:hypothetical protein PRIPAC_79085 [Pristionchus pacificus]|eukprot:PDM79175.1 hypothetical protein PRIPAC_31754 [Pristionchus pacificus]